MKKHFLLFTVLFSTLFFGQIKFEKAYFIDNSDRKIECLIKNMDWRNNPVSFEYKADENSVVKEASIKDVKSFEIYNHARYIRSTVKIDRSSNNLTNVSRVKNPEFKEEQLFLKVLISGDANLYKYADGSLYRYFYKTQNGEIEQLVYKPYKSNEVTVSYNSTYRTQLKDELSCSAIKISDINRTDYQERDLITLFLRYNKCKNPDFVYSDAKPTKGNINLHIRPRVNSSSLEFANYYAEDEHYKMEDKISFGIGLEAEYILPFNKNKWSVIIEPTYQSYKSEKTTDVRGSVVSEGKLTTTVDYHSVEIPIGIRHYMYLNGKSKLFLNAQYVPDIAVNSSIKFNVAENSIFNNLEIKSRSNVALGIGYCYEERFGLEVRYFTGREVLSSYSKFSSNYKAISFILSYKLF
ncbi:outer membrane beta-barrel protein [Chryseobacterium sp.]|uniref:outer membrane beta-barrel protein n=1 Tax=Chryseobacterium sp. TaxID=1871047 RepID=UPI0011CCC5B0|nr:outer membrane beta-barrel protein [Chryseobacterium sp.]TXF77506.1 PorT family protein [Chryseobacterium sp.]